MPRGETGGWGKGGRESKDKKRKRQRGKRDKKKKKKRGEGANCPLYGGLGYCLWGGAYLAVVS